MIFLFLKCYHKWIIKKPLVTKMVCTGVVAGIGDILSQNIEKCKIINY